MFLSCKNNYYFIRVSRQHQETFTPTLSSFDACYDLGTIGSSYMETNTLGRDPSIWWEKHCPCFIIFYGRKHLLFHIIIFKELHVGPSWTFGDNNEENRVKRKKRSVFISLIPWREIHKLARTIVFTNSFVKFSLSKKKKNQASLVWEKLLFHIQEQKAAMVQWLR